MSVPSNYTNWQPTIPVNQSIYESNADKQCPLGTKIVVGERVFHYAKATGSLGAGTVVAAAALVGSHNGALTTCAATSQDVNVLTITAGSAITANQYAEGYLGFWTGSHAGSVYRIKQHAAIGSGASGTITLYDSLYDDVGAVGINLMPNPYLNVAIGSSALATAVGVAPINIDTDDYFWAQTAGPGCPTHSAASAAAAILKLGTGGAVAAAYTGTEGPGVTGQIIGKNSSLAATSGLNNIVFLEIKR